MKKNTCTGNFTDKAGKTLVNSARFICELDGETVYCTNGIILLKLSKPEYSMVIQPATHCDAGDYEIQNGERREHKPERRLAELLKSYTAETVAASKTLAERFPCTFPTGKRGQSMTAYYNKAHDVTAYYNTAYTDLLQPWIELHTTGALNTAALKDHATGELVGMLLPIRTKNDPTSAAKDRAVAAYFNDKPITNPAKARDEYEALVKSLETERNSLETELFQTQNERNALRAELAEQTAELEELRNENEQLTAALTTDRARVHDLLTEYKTTITAQADKIAALEAGEQTAEPAAKPEPKTAAELIASRFADLAGVKTTIKGAATAAPVVWLTGDTKPHAEALKAAGAKWSGKRAAYYIRVA